MEHLLAFFLDLFPAGFDLTAMLNIFLAVFCFAIVVGFIGRLFKKSPGSGLAHATASAIAILFIYTFIAMLYRMDQDFIKSIIDNLPLIDFDGKNIKCFLVSGAKPTAIASEFLHAFILAFMVIFLDDLIPDAKNTLSWFILQFIIGLVATLVYCFVIHCLEAYVPGLLDSFAPVILVSILLFMLLLGFLKIVLGLLLVAVNPLLGAVFTFFSTSKLGQCLFKAAISVILMFILLMFLEHQGYTSFDIVNGSILSFTPIVILLLTLWFLLGKII